ncbi:hypothetical protein SAMN05518863_106126 [Candidatus Pantoea symbiotica]|jgi:hypothetical protein|uniref:Preprotein translocase subunit SecB n=1 Tax=Candidatus Pantoea symbiotica TaxID=1884370 RepID=A0A1I3YML9_9GAMM|nr:MULTISPECIES: hypothetical protein [Pantoea]SFK32609.1 hypothetical protein SAMN05518863_106126 [Pantoea symbiotica]SFU86258.1 hypothetical protein SAMN05518864_106126 [Pantoea sp. YR525]
MSAVDFIESVSLKSIRPEKLISNYDRSTVCPGEKEIKLTLQSSYGQDKSELNKYVLKFSACTEVFEDKSQKELVSVTFETHYLFDIINADRIKNISDEDRTAISSSMVFLDFRTRLIRILADVGLNSVKVPLSPINAQTSE